MHDNSYFAHTVVVQDTDLSTPQFNLMFPIDHPDTTNCIDIPITSDTELEDDHDFNVTITSAGSAPHASIGTPSVATVTIEDDESKKLCISYLNMAIQVVRVKS